MRQNNDACISDTDLCSTSACHSHSCSVGRLWNAAAYMIWIFICLVSQLPKAILEAELSRTDCWFAGFLLIVSKTEIQSQSSCSLSARRAFWHGEDFEEPLIGLSGSFNKTQNYLMCPLKVYSMSSTSLSTNVESETFQNVMPNFGSFWISRDLRIPKKLGQLAIRGWKS